MTPRLVIWSEVTTCCIETCLTHTNSGLMGHCKRKNVIPDLMRPYIWNISRIFCDYEKLSLFYFYRIWNALWIWHYILQVVTLWLQMTGVYICKEFLQTFLSSFFFDISCFLRLSYKADLSLKTKVKLNKLKRRQKFN